MAGARGRGDTNTDTYRVWCADGKELAPLGHQPYYDFNHQQMDYVDSRKILPGDRFITE